MDWSLNDSFYLRVISVNLHFVLCQFPLVELLLLLGVLLCAVPLLPQLVDLLVPVSERLLQAAQRALAAMALVLNLKLAKQRS